MHLHLLEVVTMDKITRNLAIGLIILMILTPLGLLATGDTFGEWSSKEVKERLGFVPGGLEHLSHLWGAPLTDYAVPGEGSQHGSSLAYIFSAITGVAVCGGLLFIVGKRIAKN